VRAYSHGCMRVQDPAKYAEVLFNIARPTEGWTAERIKKMFGTAEQDIQLQPTPIWVHLTYQSAFVDDAGKLQIRRDVYNLDSRTIAAIKSDLVGPSGGVYRYLGDSYYGGGEWLLLASSLAWHEAVAGDPAESAALNGWVRAQATAERDLPEQVTSRAQDPAMVEPWLERWGAVANPLLWSHAMYLVAEAALR